MVRPSIGVWVGSFNHAQSYIMKPEFKSNMDRQASFRFLKISGSP